MLGVGVGCGVGVGARAISKINHLHSQIQTVESP